jgi:hypothetical protein
MKILAIAIALLWTLPAKALILDVQITPADGFVSVGQEVGMVLTVTNDSSSPRPGLTIINTNEIDGLTLPDEVAPCVLGVAQLNPPTSPISYVLLWDLFNLVPNETRRCESKFRIRAIPNGVIPIVFRNSGTTLASVSFRAKPILQAPSINAFGLGFLGFLFLSFAYMRFRND